MFCTVASQPITPRGLAHTASNASRLVGGIRSTPARGSTKAIEVGEDRMKLFGGERDVGHPIAGLERLGICDPAGAVAFRVREQSCRECAAADEVREVGSSLSEEREPAANSVT